MKDKKFIYLATQDENYLFLLAKIITYNVANFPDAEHIIVPQSGIKFYSDKRESKFPAWLKQVQIKILDQLLDFKSYRYIKGKTKQLINKESITTKIIFTSFYSWALVLFKMYIFQFFSKNPALSYDLDENFVKYFKVSDVPAGDLVADSYTRYSGRAKFTASKGFTRSHILRAKSLYVFFDRLTQGHSGIFFGQYGSYVHHGVPLRVAYNKKWPCVTFASAVSLYKVQYKGGYNSCIKPNHTANHNSYSINQAEQLDRAIIEKAGAIITRRLSGNYDKTMSYMTNVHNIESKFSLDFNRLDGYRVLMLHDFFDSVHTYSWVLFPDFWQWCTETIDYCISQNIKLAIKPHPNAVQKSIDPLNQLKKIYKSSENIIWISPSVPNSLLFSHNICSVISVYGSVVAECAYLQIPIIMAGDHPAIKFDLGYTATTKQEYFNLISQSDLPPINNSKYKAVLFTAMHHYKNITGDGDSLRAHFGYPLIKHTNKALSDIDSYLAFNIPKMMSESLQALSQIN